jgi:CRP-like cAMP-binding protein
MMAYIRPIIDLLSSLERSAGEEFNSLLVPFQLPKGSCLVREGCFSTRLWILNSGIARLFSSRMGDEVTCNFFFPGEFFGSYSSSALKTESNSTLQLITDATGWYIAYQDLENLKINYPVVAQIEQKIVACYLSQTEMRELRLRCLDAAEHYQYLQKYYPEYICYIPLTYIASYLGISLGSLSRIRATAILKQPFSIF